MACGLSALLVLNGTVRLNEPDRARYPVWGVDVSAWQGEVDWPVLAAQGPCFAFLKATEGSSARDPRFAENWEGAHNAGLRVGAYHFFSFDSPGGTQAQNFIDAVPVRDGALPPAVDIEFYGGYAKNPADARETAQNLDALLSALEARYGQKPILYATMRSYRLYLSGRYEGYPIWIRDVYLPARLPDGRDWTFWQYSDKGRLDGYQGGEDAIDLNVFYGTREQFDSF